MQRLETGIVYHLSDRHIACSCCGAVWQEHFVGVATARDGGVNPLCPRCIPSSLKVDLVIDAEAKCTLGLAALADPATVWRTVAERYAEFLNSAPLGRGAVRIQ